VVPRTAQGRLTDAQLIAVLLIALWVLGTLGAITAGWLVVVAAFLHVPWLALPVLLLTIGTVYLIGLAARDVMPPASKPWPRLLWAVVVGTSGVLGAIFVLEVAEAFEPSGWTAFPFLGLPMALVAGLFVRDRRIRTAAGILTAGLVAGGIAVPAALPEDTAARRLASIGIPHDRTLAADLGRRDPDKATADSGSLILEYNPGLFVSPVWTFTTDAVESCETSVKTNWRLDNATCTRVGDGEFLRQNTDRIEFIQRRGPVSLHLAGNHNWKPDELRELAGKTHPLTDAEIMSALPKASGGNRTDVVAGYADFVRSIFVGGSIGFGR
jgi:hypothetical protein